MNLNNLLSRTNKIKERQTAIDNLQGDLKRDARELIPDVLAHFNHFVTSTLNPVMPAEYEVKPSSAAEYSPQGFIIAMGPICRLNRPEYRVWPGERAIEAVRQYKEGTPWVADIETTFCYPK